MTTHDVYLSSTDFILSSHLAGNWYRARNCLPTIQVFWAAVFYPAPHYYSLSRLLLFFLVARRKDFHLRKQASKQIFVFKIFFFLSSRQYHRPSSSLQLSQRIIATAINTSNKLVVVGTKFSSIPRPLPQPLPPSSNPLTFLPLLSSLPSLPTMEPWIQEQAMIHSVRPAPLDGRASYQTWTGVFSTFISLLTTFSSRSHQNQILLLTLHLFHYNRRAVPHPPSPGRSVSGALRSKLGTAPVALSCCWLRRKPPVFRGISWPFHREYLLPQISLSTSLVLRFSDTSGLVS